MRYLFTIDDLLVMRTNGWSCVECGRAWLGTSFAEPVFQGDPECPHPKLVRALLRVEAAA